MDCFSERWDNGKMVIHFIATNLACGVLLHALEERNAI